MPHKYHEFSDIRFQRLLRFRKRINNMYACRLHLLKMFISLRKWIAIMKNLTRRKLLLSSGTEISRYV